MKSTFKTKLLLGAAVTALSFGAASTDALANAETLAGNVTWAIDADQNGAPADGTGAAASDAVDISTFTLTVLNTTADDGGGVGTYTLGAVTGTTGTLAITSDANAVDLTATIASVTLTGAGDFTVATLDADDSTVAATVSGATTIGGNLSVTSTEASAADTVTLTLTGNATVTGTTTLTAGDLAAGGTTAILNVDGASNTFTGAVTVTGGGGNAANDASLIITGAATTFTGGLTLTDATGQAILTMDGATAQTVAGNIAGTGDINVDNASGATFSGTVGAGTNVITVEKTTGNSSATFQNTVNAATITLGTDGNAGDVNTLTFDTSTQGFTVTGTVDGVVAETNAVVVSGGNTLITATAWGGVTGGIDTLTVSGSGTKLDQGAAITADAITIGSGATLEMNAAINGTIDGAGTLDVDTGATFTGALGGTTQVGAVDIAAVTLTQGAASGYSAATTTFSADGTLALLGGNQTVAGNFTNSTDAEGTVSVSDVAGTTAFTGNLGASTSNSLKALTILNGGTQANIVTTTGNLFVDTITVPVTDELRLIGTSAQTVSGTITGSAGIVTVGTGTSATNATFDGVIDIDTLTVEDAATATFNSTVETDANLVVGGATTAGTATFNSRATIGGTSTLDGTILFGNENATTANTFTGAVTVAGNQASTVTLAGHSDIDGGLTVGASGATFLIKKTATFDPTDADGNGTANEATDMILDASTVAFTRTGTTTIGLASDTLAIDNGSTIQVAVDDGTGAFATGLGDGTLILQDTAFIDLQDNTSTATALNIKVVTKAASSVIASNSQGVGAADALLAISNANATNELGTIKGSLQGAATAQEAQDIAESISPTVDGGAFAGATVVTGATANITNTQLASLRDGTETGMVAGNISHGLRAWGQAFGQTGEQDTRDGIAGFDVDTYGFAVGVDTETLAEDWIWGLAFAYADTEVDSNNVNATQTDIDSYQVSLYSNYDIDDRTYVSGQLGYVWGENDQTRSNIGVAAGAGGGLVANADYDSETWIARFETGRKYAVGQSTILTPKALVNYMHYSADGYTETGTVGNAGLVVNSEDMDMLEIGVGLDASWDFQQADGSYLQPKIGVGVRHDVIGDEYETTSRFIGAGGNFKTNGFDPAQTTFNVGTGVTYYSTSNWELNAGYDYEVKSDYDAHSLTARAAYKF